MWKQQNEAFFWSLFSVGGMIAAVFVPIYAFTFFLAAPLGWIALPGYERLAQLEQMPAVKLYLLLMCTLPLFHWAHRFRYTLYDGLQVKHLNEVIFTVCYGGAVVGSIVAVYLLLR